MIGAILSGTSTDGTLGLDAIRADGRISFAQDGSARDDSMPRSVIAVGCVDFVLSPEDIASAPPRGSQAGSLGEERPIRAPFLNEPSHSKDAGFGRASRCLRDEGK